MKIDAKNYVIRVHDDPEAIDTTEAKTGANVSLESVNALPINNRTITGIAGLSPGTSSDANGLVIRGSQATQVQYLVDGAVNGVASVIGAVSVARRMTAPC